MAFSCNGSVSAPERASEMPWMASVWIRSWNVGKSSHSGMRFARFADFWPQYVRAHSRYRTRVLHAIGSVLAVIMVALSFSVSLWFLLGAPVVGYAFAWYSHLV